MSYYDSPFYNRDLTMSPLQPQQNVQQPYQQYPQQMQGYGYYNQPQQQMQNQGYNPSSSGQQTTPPPIDTTDYSNLTTGGFSFTVRKDADFGHNELVVMDDGTIVEPAKKKRGRPRKSETQTTTTEIVRADDNTAVSNQEIPTMYTYQETTNMLRGTLGQIDELAVQIKNELDTVAASRTLRNKYGIMANLSENLSDIISNKISAIKEINNAISRSNEMDYKREKDRKSAEGNVNDDKYIMDMYNAFIQNPMGNPNANVLGPTGTDATLLGSTGIVRVSDQPQQQGFVPDNGYLSYVANMTPEQRLMMVDNNPNVKMCVIFDAATGNKVFQYMDMSTGQTVDGLPTRDPMFMEDTTIDLKTKTARNINLNETYPVIVINEGVTQEY